MWENESSFKEIEVISCMDELIKRNSTFRANLDDYDIIENVGPAKSLFMPTSLYVSPREYNYSMLTIRLFLDVKMAAYMYN